jgi:threonine/homoserine/homoserine lactone efflux protein
MDPFLTGVLAGYGIAIPVGAIALLIIETGIRRGFRVAFAAGAGAATADLIYAGAAVVSGTAIVNLVSTIEEPLRLASGALLAGIALFGLWKARSRGLDAGELTVPRGRDLTSTYARFLGLTLVNPTTVVYFVAVVVGLGIASGMSTLEGTRFVIGAALASLSWQTLIAWLGASVGGRLSTRARTMVSIGGYLLIFGLAVMILVG